MAKMPAPAAPAKDEPIAGDTTAKMEVEVSTPAPGLEHMFNGVKKPPVDEEALKTALTKPEFKGNIVPGQQVPLHAANLMARDSEEDRRTRNKKRTEKALDVIFGTDF
jgi:hypothetical protein